MPTILILRCPHDILPKYCNLFPEVTEQERGGGQFLFTMKSFLTLISIRKKVFSIPKDHHDTNSPDANSSMCLLH